MKYLTSSTTSMSIVIAVGLFALASWIEGERSPPEPIARGPAPVLEPRVGTDSPTRNDSTMQSCREAEQDLLIKIEASQSCEVDSDCTIFDYGYPIQCLTSVARAEISSLRLEYRNYEQSCTYRVYYDCPSEPLERHPVCRDKRCAVELRTIDVLEDQTLDHIGVRPESRLRPRPRGNPTHR